MVGGFPFASTSGKTLVQAMRDRDFPYLVSAQQASEEDRRIKAMNLCDFMAFIFRNVVFCICSGSAFSLSAEKRTRNIGINGRNSA